VGTVLHKEELDGIPGSMRRGRHCCSQYEATLETEAAGRRVGGRRPSDEEDVEEYCSCNANGVSEPARRARPLSFRLSLYCALFLRLPCVGISTERSTVN
jgi:hypothetical protein